MEFQKKDQASVIDKLNNRIIALEQQLKTKDEFLSHAVHELKGLIHNIYFLIDYLEGCWLNIIPSEQLKHIRTIKESSEYLKELSRDLLNLAQVSSEPTIYNFDHVNLLDITKDSIEHSKKTFLGNKDLQIEFQNNGINQAITYCDSNRIRLVINNFLNNAIKYGDTKLISINLVLKNSNQKNYWQLSISDQGIGIPEGDLDNIFKPFFRSANTEASPGHGLGLAICKQITEANNGMLTAINNKNQGSTFLFSLPAV
jgi:signal transduction histidine kinase